jgi:hypothetical protein
MTARFNRLQTVVPIELSEILDTTAKRLRVRIKATGEPVWLPRSCTQIHNGMAFVPQWLADKIALCGQGSEEKYVRL